MHEEETISIGTLAEILSSEKLYKDIGEISGVINEKFSPPYAYEDIKKYNFYLYLICLWCGAMNDVRLPVRYPRSKEIIIFPLHHNVSILEIPRLYADEISKGISFQELILRKREIISFLYKNSLPTPSAFLLGERKKIKRKEKKPRTNGKYLINPSQTIWAALAYSLFYIVMSGKNNIKSKDTFDFLKNWESSRQEIKKSSYFDRISSLVEYNVDLEDLDLDVTCDIIFASEEKGGVRIQIKSRKYQIQHSKYLKQVRAILGRNI